MVKYGIPNLIPEYIYFDEEMSKIVDQYTNSAELANHLNNYINHPKLLNKQTLKVREFISIRYNVSNILSDLNYFMDNVILVSN
jgi:hypothetical protein